VNKVIHSKIYLGTQHQPNGDMWGKKQVGLKDRIGSKPVY